MPFDPQRFESLGANCEFGFFLQSRGNVETSLFRWAEVIGLDGLTRLFRNDFQDMFSYESVVPFNANMVMDQNYWIAWHSKFEVEVADPSKPFSRMNAKFKTPEPDRRVLWQEQSDKLQHFVEKLRGSLRSGERIFVCKPRGQDTVMEAEIVSLSEAMRSYGPNLLLAVTLANKPEDIGTVRLMRPGLLRGYIDRFAPGDRADDYSAEIWDRLCEAALVQVNTVATGPTDESRAASVTLSARNLLAKAAASARRWVEFR